MWICVLLAMLVTTCHAKCIYIFIFFLLKSYLSKQFFNKHLIETRLTRSKAQVKLLLSSCFVETFWKKNCLYLWDVSKYEDTLLLSSLFEMLSGDKSAQELFDPSPKKTNKFNSLTSKMAVSPKSRRRAKKSKAAEVSPLNPSKQAEQVKTMRAKYSSKAPSNSMHQDRLRDLLRDMLRDLLRDLLRDYMRDFKRDLFKLYEESSTWKMEIFLFFFFKFYLRIKFKIT